MIKLRNGFTIECSTLGMLAHMIQQPRQLCIAVVCTRVRDANAAVQYRHRCAALLPMQKTGSGQEAEWTAPGFDPALVAPTEKFDVASSNV